MQSKVTNKLKHIISLLSVLLLLTATIASAADPKQANDYDVIVIGGTPAGVAAAIAAARADKTVIIIEQAPVPRRSAFFGRAETR